MLRIGIIGAVGLSAALGSARADGTIPAEPPPAHGTLLADDTWNYVPGGDLVVDGGLVVGLPAALPTGLAAGVGAGVAHGHGLVIGARAAWLTTTESSTVWTVTNSDLRLRVTGAVESAAGRGAISLRLGLGGTLVHETRVRNQGMRAGLSGSDLETTALAMLPAADLDLVVALHVTGRFLLQMTGGPSIDLLAGSPHMGWSAQLGVAWRP